MMTFLSKIRNRFSQAGVSVPAMDGALRPNSILDKARIRAHADAPDNLVFVDGVLCFSSGDALVRVDNSKVIQRFEAPISATASDGLGTVAIALENGALVFLGDEFIPLRAGLNITAMCFGKNREIYFTTGSKLRQTSLWKHDLMSKGNSGSIWQYNPNSAELLELAKGLPYPNGICPSQDGKDLVVSLAWSHSVVTLSLDGNVLQTRISDLPAYPSRIVPSQNGYWLALFAPRSQLVEFVLKEDAYRNRMMRDIDPDFWVCPTLSSGASFLEPLQLGAIRTMGQIKPWAPTRSYGLVIGISSEFVPIRSAHSRADGTFHGVTSLVEDGEDLIIASKGGNAILSLKENAFDQGQSV